MSQLLELLSGQLPLEGVVGGTLPVGIVLSDTKVVRRTLVTILLECLEDVELVNLATISSSTDIGSQEVSLIVSVKVFLRHILE